MIPVLLFLLCWGISVRSQSYQAPKKSEPLDLPEQNAFYVELLGSAGAYSLDYERLIVLGPPISLRGRVGVSFFGGSFVVPAYLQMSHPFWGPVKLEWGGGVNLLPRLGGGGPAYEWGALLGPRYRTDLGLLFRLSYTPRFPRGDEEGPRVRHWGGLSIGFLF